MSKMYKEVNKKAAEKSVRMSKKDIMELMDEFQAIPNMDVWEGIEIPKTEEGIAREIILAQVASDGGKGEHRFVGINPQADEAWGEGYDVKDDHILKAILGIVAADGCSEFSWYISSDFEEYDDDWYGDSQMQSIIYFEWRGYQISFHSFSSIWKEVAIRYGFQTCEWDGLSSPFTCLKLWEHYFNSASIRPLVLWADNDPGYRFDDLAVPFREVSGVTARTLWPECGVARHYYRSYDYEGNPLVVVEGGMYA